ncbi:MAG: HEAT repeat domain-containing protein [Myxococcaceae bacterium]|jgi:HEAT repeat protein|nr:HEAT repeat domain-containing protein [Myxococcaceae bacterium]MCA3011076.1 HEAT repeat domain-containing protein [Myxococcaceae bacterium]
MSMRLFTLAALVAAAPALAQDVTPALRRVLSAIDSPPSKAQLVEAGGKDPAAALRALAADGRQALWLRRAALSALGHFDGLETRTALGRLARDADPTVRKGAVETLGFLTKGTDVALRGALADEVPMVRRSAARALWRAGDAMAREALARRLEVEDDGETRAVLAQALGR